MSNSIIRSGWTTFTFKAHGTKSSIKQANDLQAFYSANGCKVRIIKTEHEVLVLWSDSK